MNKKHKYRLVIILVLALGLSVVILLVLYALKQNINLFYTPEELVQSNVPNTARIRVGGMVLKGSFQQDTNLNSEFYVSDYKQQVLIRYTGVLPDLFREGQGVVALGRYQNNIFHAEQILAKHDENYMPPNLKDTLTKNVG